MKFKEYSSEVNRVAGMVDETAVDELIAKLKLINRRGQLIATMGNGGSAATAAHFAADLAKNALTEPEWPYSTICLNDNASAITAYANDTNYDYIFTEQLKRLYNSVKLVIGITCSGKSKNVIQAINYANEMGMITAVLSGFEPNNLAGELAHINIHVKSFDYEIVEDIHSMILHHIVRELKHIG